MGKSPLICQRVRLWQGDLEGKSQRIGSLVMGPGKAMKAQFQSLRRPISELTANSARPQQ